VVVKMPAAGERDPGIARADHTRAGVKGENEHSNNGDDSRRFASQKRSCGDLHLFILLH